MSVVPPRPAWGSLEVAFKAQGVAKVEIVETPGPHRGKILIEFAVPEVREGRLPLLLARDQLGDIIARLMTVPALIDDTQIFPPELAEFLARRRVR